MSFLDWITNSNNPDLDKSEYLFGTRHIIMLAITFILCVGLSLLFRKRSEKSKNVLLYSLASILLFFEITTRIVNLWILDVYNVKTILDVLLPMHICSVMVWVIIIGIFSKSKILLNYSAIVGFLATLAFLLYPAVGINQKYMAFTNIYSTVSHMIGFTISILLMTLKRVEFKFSKIWQPYLCLIIMFTWGYLLNWVIFPGSDFMYMRNDPLGLELNFHYYFLYIPILIVYVLSFYVISACFKKKRVDETSEVKEELSEEDIILSIIKSNPKVIKRDIAISANIEMNELENHIKDLKARGKLERVGQGKAGYWKVN